MPNGPLGCRTHVSVLVHFGLIFLGFFCREFHLDAFLICILKINRFSGYSGLYCNDYRVDKYSKKS